MGKETGVSKSLRDELKAAIGDGTQIDRTALKKIREQHPDEYLVFLREQAESMMQQLEEALKTDMSLEQELQVRNWIASYLSALGVDIKRLTREELQALRQEKKSKLTIEDINARAHEIEAEEAMQIMQAVYNAGKTIPGELSKIWNKRQISTQEELELVRKWLAMPSLGDAFGIV